MEKNVKSRLKNTEYTLRERIGCEKQAFYIVNKLIDGCVDAQYLSDCGKQISQVNYDDIVEERAISMLCGYPICDQNLPNVPRKKYHISTKANKVYDISERKNFCSNQCFKASKSFRQQIPESPVWTREAENTNITISPHKTMTGLVGEEVIGKNPTHFLQEELETLQEMDEKYGQKNGSNKKNRIGKQLDHKLESEAKRSEETQSVAAISTPENICDDRLHVDLDNLNLEDSKAKLNESELCEKDKTDSVISRSSQMSCTSFSADIECIKEVTGKSVNSSESFSKLEKLQKLLNQRKNVLSGMIDLQEAAAVSTKEGCLHEKNESSNVKLGNSEHVISGESSQPEQINVNPSVKSFKRKSVPSPLPPSPLQCICQVLKTWSSSTTVEFLQMKTSHTDSGETRLLKFSDPHIQAGHAKLCKNLDLPDKQLESVIEEYDTDFTNSTDDCKDLKTVPDYNALKEEAEQFQLKVTEFITGKRPVKEKTKEKNDTSNDVVYNIPPIDTYDQLQIRAKIILERLDRSLPDVLIPMGLSVQDISSQIRELVYTFRLEKDNIIFRPAEWTLVSLILLKMLSYKSKSINEVFKKDSAVQHFTVLLKGMKHTLDDLEIFTQEILYDVEMKFNSEM